MDRSTIATVDTYTLAVYFLAGWVFAGWINKDKIMQRATLLTLYSAAVGASKVWVLYDLNSRHDLGRTHSLYIMQSLFERLNFSMSFLCSFAAVIAPFEFGSTFLTFFMVVYNIGEKLPSTLGFFLINSGLVDFFVYGWLVYLLHFVAAGAVFPCSVMLDQCSKEAFSIESAEQVAGVELQDRPDASLREPLRHGLL